MDSEPALIDVQIGDERGVPVSTQPYANARPPSLLDHYNEMSAENTATRMPHAHATVRTRRNVHQYATRSQDAHERPPSPLGTYSYGEESPTSCFSRISRAAAYVKEAIVPASEYNRSKKNDAWTRSATPRRPPSACRRGAQLLCAALLVFLIGSAAMLALDWASASYEVDAMHTAELVKMFDGVFQGGREGKLREVLYLNVTTENADGSEEAGVFAVHNVLQPAHAVETLQDVHTLFRKLTDLDMRARSLTPHQLRAGYVTYKHERVGDADADLLEVNATLDGIEALIVRDRREGVRCESYLQYGLEYNAVVLFAHDEEPTQVLYNAKIDAHADSVAEDGAAVKVRSRIHEATEMEDEDAVTVKNVPKSITVEYNSRDGKRNRLKIVDAPAAACVAHSLLSAGRKIPWPQ